MENYNLGYCCINTTLQKKKITTNRGMIRRTFMDKGIDYASELGLLNVIDLEKIIRWNNENGFNLFRMTSNLFPWSSEYELSEMPDFDEISERLLGIGKLSYEFNQRITSHPGPFNVLVSPKESVVENTIKELSVHGEVFDLMGLKPTHQHPINIHCNGVYGDKQKAMDRFCMNFDKLPQSVQNRLTIENDDKASMYSVSDLMYIHDRIGIPIVFDYHHHKFNTGGLSEKEALELAMSTWGDGIVPVVHYSESKLVEDTSSKPQAHSSYIYNRIDTYGHRLDIEVEAKAKELTVLKYRSEFINGELDKEVDSRNTH